jgi:hypothetical protein
VHIVVHEPFNSLAVDLHEQLLLDYGTLLMSHHSLWQVGISYLDYCPKEGHARIEVLLSTLPFGSEARALKIIQAARDRDLHHIGKLVLKYSVTVVKVICKTWFLISNFCRVLYVFFWVIPRRLSVICRCFGTHTVPSS